MNPELPLAEKPTNETYYLAAQIKGKLKVDSVPMSDQAAEAPADGAAGDKDAKDAEPKDADKADTKDAPSTEGKAAPTDADKAATAEPVINVVVVADIDCLYGAFFALRARGEDPDVGV